MNYTKDGGGRKMQEVKPEEFNCSEVTLIDTVKAEKAIKKAARWAYQTQEYSVDQEKTLGYLECLSDLGLI